MLNKKQLKFLKSQAQSLTPSLQIGKNGLSVNFLKQLQDQIELQELIKINWLQMAPVNRTEVVSIITQADSQITLVQQIGHTAVFYRPALQKKHQQLSLEVAKIKG